jgi:FkbM family methyltransferase
MRSLKRFLPFGAKLWAKEVATSLLNIPFSRFGVPIAIMSEIPRTRKITLVDVGASQGTFAASMDRYCGIQKAFLIEPQPKRVEQMKATFNGKPFYFACAAASSEERLMEMEVLNWDFSSSILPVRRDLPAVNASIDLGVREKIQVQASTLDNLCERSNFDGLIDLLKIDVQGAESLVIAGATKTLPRVGLIWMELSLQPLYEGSVTAEGVIRLCNEQGFMVKRLEEGFSSTNGELLQVDALFVPRPRS